MTPNGLLGKDDQGRKVVSILAEHIKLEETNVLAILSRTTSIPDIYSITGKRTTKNALLGSF